MRPEEKIEQAVVAWAEARGWDAIKMNIQGNRGYPDRLFISQVGVHVWIEFKRPGEKPRKLQDYRLKALRKRSVHATWVDSVAHGQEMLKFYE